MVSSIRVNATKPLIVVAGGTGGHVFPALRVALGLKKLGKPVVFITDERACQWVQGVDHVVVHRLRGSGRLTFGLRLLLSGFKSLWLFLWHRPAAVIGFGGYPSAPPVFAAQMLRIPTLIHECNSLLGRANEVLCRHARKVTTGFPGLKTREGVPSVAFEWVGNPLRSGFEVALSKPYVPPKETIRLLITGGSQGSHALSKRVATAISLIPEDLRKRLQIVHQVREHDLDEVQGLYEQIGVQTTLKTFFDDMPEQMQQAHLMIARSGALTLAEIAAVGVPSILIPLASSRDGDQLDNALQFQNNHAAVCLEEHQATPEALAKHMEELLRNPDQLEAMSQAARSLAVPQAAERLIALAIHIASLNQRES